MVRNKEKGKITRSVSPDIWTHEKEREKERESRCGGQVTGDRPTRKITVQDIIVKMTLIIKVKFVFFLSILSITLISM